MAQTLVRVKTPESAAHLRDRASTSVWGDGSSDEMCLAITTSISASVG